MKKCLMALDVFSKRGRLAKRGSSAIQAPVIGLDISGKFWHVPFLFAVPDLDLVFPPTFVTCSTNSHLTDWPGRTASLTWQGKSTKGKN
jgi:hypothetical protein